MFNGETKTIDEWSKITGVPKSLIRSRLYKDRELTFYFLFKGKKKRQTREEINAKKNAWREKRKSLGIKPT